MNSKTTIPNFWVTENVSSLNGPRKKEKKKGGGGRFDKPENLYFCFCYISVYQCQIDRHGCHSRLYDDEVRERGR